jgi:hypothetical protein
LWRHDLAAHPAKFCISHVWQFTANRSGKPSGLTTILFPVVWPNIMYSPGAFVANSSIKVRNSADEKNNEAHCVQPAWSTTPFQNVLQRYGLLGLGIGGPSVLGANVGSKLFVTLGLVLTLHFIQ